MGKVRSENESYKRPGRVGGRQRGLTQRVCGGKRCRGRTYHAAGVGVLGPPGLHAEDRGALGGDGVTSHLTCNEAKKSHEAISNEESEKRDPQKRSKHVQTAASGGSISGGRFGTTMFTDEIADTFPSEYGSK
jgi:hypothetical protein